MARNPRGVATVAVAWVAVLLLTALPVLAQTAFTPPGTGTAADPYRISALGHLVWMGDTAEASAGKYYVLLNDIDATATASWNDAGTDTSILEGFRPIGTPDAPFTGELDGRMYVIRGLTIRRPGTDGVGLFGGIGYSSEVHHLGLEGGSVTGRDHVGGLVGASLASTQIEESCAKGSVTGSNYVGGLVGATDSGEEVIRCYARGAGPREGPPPIEPPPGQPLEAGRVRRQSGQPAHFSSYSTLLPWLMRSKNPGFSSRLTRSVGTPRRSFTATSA